VGPEGGADPTAKKLDIVATPETRQTALTMAKEFVVDEARIASRIGPGSKETVASASKAAKENLEKFLSLTPEYVKKTFDNPNDTNRATFMQPFDHFDAASVFTAYALAFGVDIAQQIYTAWSGGRAYSGKLIGGYTI
jgi:hypothetical protein